MKKKVYYYQIFASKADENGIHHSSQLKKTELVFDNETNAKTFCEKQSTKRKGVIFIYKPFVIDFHTNLSKVEDIEYSSL